MRLLLHGSAQLLLDAGDLGGQRAGVTFAIVELGRHGDAVAIDAMASIDLLSTSSS